MPLFEGYVAVDWSSNTKPKKGKDSIWIAHRGPEGAMEPRNPRTRQEAMDYIEKLLMTAQEKHRRLLCGFDFAFGYPKGTARAMTGQSDWEAVWERISGTVRDDPDNQNNRFVAAARLNACFEGKGPFWGRAVVSDIAVPSRWKPLQGWGTNLPLRRRHAETVLIQDKTVKRKPQEVWGLSGIGAVGSQTLTGIPRLQELRRCHDVQVWPFETLGDGRSHVLAEIYPSLINPCPMDGIDTNDERQVRAVAAALQELDRTGELRQYLRAPCDMDMPDCVRREEGAILGMHDPGGFEAARQRVMPCC